MSFDHDHIPSTYYHHYGNGSYESNQKGFCIVVAHFYMQKILPMSLIQR